MRISDDGGVAALGLEVALAELQVTGIHSQAQILGHDLQTGTIQLQEAFHGGNGLGDLIVHHQGLGLLESGLTALHGVDDILADGGDLLIGQLAGQHIDLGGADQGTLTLGDDLDALGSGVGPLVKLTGQRFHSEDISAGQLDGCGSGIQLGLGENGTDGIVEQLFGDVFCVIAVEKTDILKRFNAQKVLSLCQQAAGFVIKAFLLFNKIR